MGEFRYFCRDGAPQLIYVSLVRPYKSYANRIWESHNFLVPISELAYSLDELPLNTAIKVNENNKIVETFYR